MLALQWHKFCGDEQGQDMVEYTLLIAFILFVVIGLASGYHGSIVGITTVSSAQLATANTSVQ